MSKRRQREECLLIGLLCCNDVAAIVKLELARPAEKSDPMYDLIFGVVQSPRGPRPGRVGVFPDSGRLVAIEEYGRVVIQCSHCGAVRSMSRGYAGKLAERVRASGLWFGVAIPWDEITRPRHTTARRTSA